MTREQEILLKMAKKALSADTSSDLISRADAMGAVQDHFNANGFNGYDDGQKMMDRINALPSADAVSREALNGVKFVAIKGDKVEEAYRSGWNGAIECIIENAPSADAEPKRVLQGYNKGANTIQTIRHEELKKIANTRKAVESADAVHGEWILVKGSDGKDYHKCSKCLHTQEITGAKNYCAVCGTRMKGGAE